MAAPDYVNALDYDVSGNLLVAGSNDRIVRLWDTRASEKPVQLFDGHEKRVASVAFNNLKDELVSGSYDSSVRMWGFKKRTTINY